MIHLPRSNKMPANVKQQFCHPDPEFTPIPFWFWNDLLDEAEIARQIKDFRDKGIMGFIIHPRIGVPKEIPYLSDRFMELVTFAVAEAKRRNMKVILYDEGMYPSGSAHGMVVEGNPEYATRGLRLIENRCTRSCEISPEIADGERIISILAVEKMADNAIRPGSERKLRLSGGKIRFAKPLRGEWSVLLFIETFTKGTIRGIHFGEDDGEPEAPPSADLMNPAAIKKFIRLTYDRYYSVLQEHFGSTIIAMFTDEPDVLGRCAAPGIIPWMAGFLEWSKQYGNDELNLPALWFEAGEDTEGKRRNYRKAIQKRLEISYYQQVSDWCEEHGIALTGHPHESDEIGLLKYFHIPGQDIVWRWVAPEEGKGLEGPHSTMGKCSSDAARHLGRRRNSNECFGCCGPNGIHWAFSADDMKWYLDWLFVRGVNLIYPHAFYYSLAGEKRSGERPPDVGPNNIWWRYYNTISDYIKRMCWLMTDSINVTEIAVLCEEDRLPWAIVKPLYRNQIEFNYLEANILLSNACNVTEGYMSIQKQQYRVLIIEDVTILSGELTERLMEFTDGGGVVIIYNPHRYRSLLEKVHEIATIDEIVTTIEKLGTRDILLLPANENLRASHIVKDDHHFYLFVNEGEDPYQGEMRIENYGTVERWDAWDGTIEKQHWQRLNQQYIKIPIRLQRRESTIICLEPSGEPEKLEVDEELAKVAAEFELKDDWKVESELWETAERRNLGSWTEWAGMEEFSGTVVYETTVELSDISELRKAELDLGKVAEITHIYVNGADAGFNLWAPYIFDVTKQIKTGINTLRVEITNSLANRISRAKLDSGLLGPVRVRLEYTGDRR